MYDVIVAGGSIAGLLCAREIASDGHSVLVIEEDYEIGTPEHCGGLISSAALEELGIIPRIKTLDHEIRSARIFSPSGDGFTINSAKQKIVEINRRELDKQVAHQAQKNGAEIRVRTSYLGQKGDCVLTGGEPIQCRMLVDARGISSIIQRDRTGMLPSAQYEVYCDWIEKGQVEVVFDSEKYPGFFAWVIPSSRGAGKVGVAGRGINSAETLERFLASRGRHSVIRKIFAPIWIKGPIKEFVIGNTVTVGDAAGQTKPTTAGGIFSCGMGGVLAGRAISKFLNGGRREDLLEYQAAWGKRFGKEFERQLLARKILERLDNRTIEKIFGAVTPEIIQEISERDDFDFHADSIIRLLGVKKSLMAAQAVLGGELRKLLG